MKFCHRGAEDAEVTRVVFGTYSYSAPSAPLRQELFLLDALRRPSTHSRQQRRPIRGLCLRRRYHRHIQQPARICVQPLFFAPPPTLRTEVG